MFFLGWSYSAVGLSFDEEEEEEEEVEGSKLALLGSGMLLNFCWYSSAIENIFRVKGYIV